MKKSEYLSIKSELIRNHSKIKKIIESCEDQSQMQQQYVIEFETALMALESFKKIPQPCPKKTMDFGVLLTKKNFDYLRPNQIKERD